jgi:hypothetical protein
MMGLVTRIVEAPISRSVIGTFVPRQGTILHWGRSMYTGRAIGTVICAGMTRGFEEFGNAHSSGKFVRSEEKTGILRCAQNDGKLLC